MADSIEASEKTKPVTEKATGDLNKIRKQADRKHHKRTTEK